MAFPRRSILIPALIAALVAGGLIWAPFVASQDENPESDEKIGTREQKTMDVDWQALRREHALEPAPEPTGPMIAGFPREKLQETRLPVLLPGDQAMVERMRLFAERDRYVASLRKDDISVQIMGTRISQGPLQAEGAAKLMKQMSDEEGYIFQRTEAGSELSFTRYGVSYNISVECREPASDPRCTEKDYVMELARSLVYVGGTPEEGDSP